MSPKNLLDTAIGYLLPGQEQTLVEAQADLEVKLNALGKAGGGAEPETLGDLVEAKAMLDDAKAQVKTIALRKRKDPAAAPESVSAVGQANLYPRLAMLVWQQLGQKDGVQLSYSKHQTLLLYHQFLQLCASYDRKGNTIPSEVGPALRENAAALFQYSMALNQHTMLAHYQSMVDYMEKEAALKEALVAYQANVLENLAAWDTHVQQQVDEYSTLWKQLDTARHKYKRASVMTHDDIKTYEQWGRWLTGAALLLALVLAAVLIVDYYRVLTSATRGLDRMILGRDTKKFTK